MDEVQSWWEVPTIAHFCYAFRDAFDLVYLDIGELEAAILNVQDPEMCVSLEQLIIRILQGCFDENEVNSLNWEEKLYELFDDNCEENENPFPPNTAFANLSARCKVEILLKLCQFRLDTYGAFEEIKDIPAEDMQANCVGKDGLNNVYWYFYDDRLYKENPSASLKKNKQSQVVNKTETSSKKRSLSSLRAPKKEEKNKDREQPWSIVCYNLSDFESLAKKFSKSKSTNEKDLVKQLNDKYIPKVSEAVVEKDQLLRKRFIELAPKKRSSRISKLQAQKQIEEQAAMENETVRKADEERDRIQRERERKKQEIEDRKKRVEARQKLILERENRASLRSRMRGYSPEPEGRLRKRKLNHFESSNEEESSSESEESEEQSSSSEESDGHCSDKVPPQKLSVRNGPALLRSEQNSAPMSNVLRNSSNNSESAKWKTTQNTNGRSLRVFRFSWNKEQDNKRLRSSDNICTKKDSAYSSPPKELRSIYNDRQTYPFQQRSLNTYSVSSS